MLRPMHYESSAWDFFNIKMAGEACYPLFSHVYFQKGRIYYERKMGRI